ncbi:MAG: hypothetical protein ACQETH_10010 [Candidatus Rifleibacteriota bacterium]
MQEITPVGIMTTEPGKSHNFYRKIMRIPRVQTSASNEFGATVLRLESPSIEINSTRILIKDRKTKSYNQTTQRLKLCCDNLEIFRKRLFKEKIEVFNNSGKLSFIDLNGINWDIYEKQLN